MIKWFKNRFLKWKCKVCLNCYYKLRSDWVYLRFSDGTYHRVNICPECSKTALNLKVRDLK